MRFVLLLCVMAFSFVIAWAVWRAYCKAFPLTRRVEDSIDRVVDPMVERAGLGELVRLKRRFNRAIQGAVDETNARVRKRANVDAKDLRR